MRYEGGWGIKVVTVGSGAAAQFGVKQVERQSGS